MITVYHNPKFSDLSFNKDIGNAVKAHLDLLEQVAEVEVDDLNKAYRLTNNIESSWTKNLHVTPVEDESVLTHGFRSTSVGDCMEKDGQLFVVAPCGFEEVQ